MPIAESMGIALPEATRWIKSGGGAGNDGVSTVCEFLVSARSPSEIAAFFARSHAAAGAAGSAFRSADGTEIVVQPADRSIKP